MRLRTLVFLAALSYTLVIGGTLAAYRLQVAYPQIKEAVLEVHNKDLQAIYSVYQNDLNTLKRFNFDWAKWDETFDYAKYPNQEYISRNIGNSGLASVGIDALAIIGNNGQTLLAYGRKNGQQKVLKDLSDITHDLDIRQLLSAETSSGLINVLGETGYFSSVKIQDSQYQNPSNGVLVFLKIIDADFMQRIDALTRSSLQILNTEQLPKGSQAYQLPIRPSLDTSYITELKADYYFGASDNEGNIKAYLHLNYPASEIPKPLDKVTIFSISALLLLPIFITIIVWFAFLQPINRIHAHINRKKFSEKHIKAIPFSSKIFEFESFIINFNEMASRINQSQYKLELESLTDSLTGIYNRRHFDEEFDLIWSQSARQKNSIAIIMLDIDYFKLYNDHYGHQQGDEAIKQVATALNSLVKRPGDLLGRYGGEEFSMVISIDSQAQLDGFLSSIINTINDLTIPHKDSAISEYLSISGGACFVLEPGQWMAGRKEEGLKMADDALYQAKEKGRKRFCIHTLNSSDLK
jgi:diguanylate cyclase (GGDEF)-like protein